MTVQQPAEVAGVLRLLVAGADERLLGVYETEWLDFKGSPYRLDEARERWELAKDVAALANSGGGLIVIGVHVTKDLSRNEDVASKIAPFVAGMIDLKRYRDVLQNDVYPPVGRLDIQQFDRGNDKILLTIVVPEQHSDHHPFLITRFVDETGVQLHAFMLPKRSGSHTSFDPVGLVHRDIADGRRSRSAGTGPLGVSDIDDEDDLATEEDRVLSLALDIEMQIEWSSIAALFLTATSSSVGPRPPDFYDRDGLRQALSTRNQLRHAGFGLTYGHDVRVVGRTLLSLDGDRTVIRVDATGTLLAGAAGTPNFLGWAQDRHGDDGGRLVVNPVALVEYVLEFCRFVNREVAPRWGDKGWRLTTLVRRAQTAERPLALRSGYDQWTFNARPAESDERIESVERSSDAHADAFELLLSVYGLFGMGADDIPFTANNRVDEQALLALR